MLILYYHLQGITQVVNKFIDSRFCPIRMKKVVQLFK